MPLSKSDNRVVSIVMGVHNEKDEHLRLAIESICHQTYNQIEFIIVDDCSDDHCKSILSEYEKRFNYIKVLHNETNLGLTKSLNVGFQYASGEFLARMDADDFSVPTRIEKQVLFLDNNSDVDICGTGVVSFGDSMMYMSPFNGMSNNEAQCFLFFSSTLCHPAVMIRKSFLDENHLAYDESVTLGQDYDLWERSSIYGKLVVMKEVLLFYRIHASQITSNNKKEQNLFADKTRLRRLSRLGLVPSENEFKCHKLLVSGVNQAIPYSDILAWVNKLIQANDSVSLVDNSSFSRELKYRLVLYKMRNNLYRELFSISDILVVLQVIISRLLLKIALNKARREFYLLVSRAR